MKIKSIRYSNFRQFKEDGEIQFNVDGKVTIVYGLNGSGKTTLHQLFKWVFYNKTEFNKTTSGDKLFNNEKFKELEDGNKLYVWGEVEFEHNNKNYLARRECQYYKNDGKHQRVSSGDEFIITEKVNKNWKPLSDPKKFLDEVLPESLSQYFFFDGETMVADLKQRSTRSAKILQKTLYSLFDLEAYEKAKVDLSFGTHSVKGLLQTRYNDIIASSINSSETQKYIREIENLSKNIENNIVEKEEKDKKLNEVEERLAELYQLIGESKSTKQLESSRTALRVQKENTNADLQDLQLVFGKSIVDKFSTLLITKVVLNARERIYLKVQNSEYSTFPGLTKELVKFLISEKNERKKCICGDILDEKNIDNLKQLLRLFPPQSYKDTYDKYVRMSEQYLSKNDPNELNDTIKNILKKNDLIKNIESEINAIDDEMKNVGNIDDLVDERKEKDIDKKNLQEKITELNNIIDHDTRQKKLREDKLSKNKNTSKDADHIDAVIGFIDKTCEQIEIMLNNELEEYRKDLENSIEKFIKNTLTASRSVTLTNEFELKVSDSHDDESKSEGQFAVVSFAYIAGIMEVLKKHEKLKGKIFPLVLDGPFSKLDEIQKTKVIKELPSYAPQVIIFSKDKIDNYFDKNIIGYEWTITSNEEQNISKVKEGCIWK